MIYSGWVTYNGYNFFRTGIEVSTSSSNTSVTITVKTYIQLASGSHEGFWNFRGSTNAGGGYTSYVAGNSSYLQDTSNHQISSASHTVSRTHANQTVSVAGQAYDSYLGTGTGTASSSVTVSPRSSYAITYNANGGSNAPAAQTKWYDESITLQKGVPTRTNYEFLGWSTNKGATAADSAYTKAKMTAGASYTGNAALALYAVWKLAFVAPTITKVTAFRSDSSGDSDQTSTSHIHVDVTWKVDTAVKTENTGKTLAIVITKGTSTIGSASSSVSATSATTGFTIAPSSGTFDINSAYTITATLTDKYDQTTKRVAFVSRSVKPFTMTNEGLSAGFFGIAKSTLKHVLQIFGDADNDPALRFYSARGNVQGGAAVPSANTAIASELVYDSTEYNAYYSQLMHNTSDQIYHSYVMSRKNSSGTAYMHGFYIYLNANGKPVLSFTSNNTGNSGSPGAVPYAWHKAISTWKQLATAKSGTAMTFTLPDDCTEVMVAAICTTTSSNIRVYGGSVVIPMALLSTTNTEWLLGGGSVGNTTSSSGTRYCAVQITTTKATGVGAYSDGTNHASTTTFYVYAR